MDAVSDSSIPTNRPVSSQQGGSFSENIESQIERELSNFIDKSSLPHGTPSAAPSNPATDAQKDYLKRLGYDATRLEKPLKDLSVSEASVAIKKLKGGSR